MRYSNGEAHVDAADLPLSQGGLFGHSLSYGQKTSAAFGSGAYAGPSGYNWFVNQIPYAFSSGSLVGIIFSPKDAHWFTKSGSTYTPLYGWLQVGLKEDATLPTTLRTLTFTRNVGRQIQVVVFNSFSHPSNPGAFVSAADIDGVQINVTYGTGTQVSEVQRSYTLGGTTTTDSLLYDYVTSGSATGLLQSVTYRQQVGGGSWNPIRRVLSGYYGASDPNGSVNDLQSLTQQLPDGAGGWNTVSVRYFRYWLPGSSTGFAHGLKLHLGPEAYRAVFNAGIDPTAASDTTLRQYADHYFEYDPSSQRVSKAVSAVCPSCAGGGSTSDTFTYASNPRSAAPGYGTWATRTTQTLPDNSQVIVYSDSYGLPILRVTTDAAGTKMWGAFYRYDQANNTGQVIWEAQPSAVLLPPSLSTLEANDDLLNYDGTTGQYQYLNASSGLIRVTDYYASTNIALGQAQYYVQNRKVRQGQAGADVLLSSYTYTSNSDSPGNTVYAVAEEKVYPDAGNPATFYTTSYVYVWAPGTNQLQQVTTRLPAVPTDQNGSGSSDTTVQQFDAYGNRTRTTDERGVVNSYTFVGLGLVQTQVLNVQSGVTEPGANVTSDFTYDTQGRLTLTLGPSHTAVVAGAATTVRRAAYAVYNESTQPASGTWGPDSTWTAAGYAAGTGPNYTYAVVDPVSIVNRDKDGRTLDQITSHRSTGSGALSPTDTFVQTDWQTWSSTQYDNQHRTVSRRTYFLIPSSGSGIAGTNYGETAYGYDSLERQNRVVSAGGTITRTVWATPQRAASVWMGTDDTGATDSNPAGSGSPNNMVLVTQNQYDNGSAGGNGNLTQQTLYVSSTPGDTRVSTFGYDFRGRRVSEAGPEGFYAAYTFDNLDHVTLSQRHDTSAAGNLIAQSGTKYDARGRAYQQLIYAVDPNTGNVGNVLTGNTWFDPSGNRVQQTDPGAGQVFSKWAYNGVGWTTATYTGYNSAGTSYGQAQTVLNDTIVEQAQNTFDEAGNVVSVASFQRLNDATGSGALSDATQPKARVSYAANWFDGIDRAVAAGNYGAVASFSRPDAPPSSSATVLVNQTSFDSAGRVFTTTDPMGIVNRIRYDSAGRTIQTVEDLGTGAHLHRTTNYTYSLDALIATMTAVNPTTGDQTTTWTYGTTLSASGVARNDLLASVAYPDSVSGSDVVSYTYNRLGERQTITDQRGTTRTLYRDGRGRLTNDCVTTVGIATDTAVLQIATAYEVRGMVQTITSLDSPTVGGGTVINQVQLTYNSFAQLIKDQQEHSGAVTSSSPSVQYGYDSGESGSNEIRLNALTYPTTTRTINYRFGTAGGMSDRLNRIDSIMDSSSGITLAAYTYLGREMVLRIDYPQPQVRLDLWGGVSGTITGLDAFNRVIDQRWLYYGAGGSITSSSSSSSSSSGSGGGLDLDHYQHGYDQNSNRLYKANLVGTSVVSDGLDELYAYDNLNRLTDMQRGVLNTVRTVITGTPAREIAWTLDPTGNWSAYASKTHGTMDLNQGRTSNPANEITVISSSGGTPVWATPTYDAAGNTAMMPRADDPATSINAIYDAWNRTTTVSTAGVAVVRSLYDGQNRRTVKLTYTGGRLSETRHFYQMGMSRDVEERIDTSAAAERQAVWGIRYVGELICRYRSVGATPMFSSSSSSSSGAANELLYALQDANFNVTALVTTAALVEQRFVYDPYGEALTTTADWVAAADAYDWTHRYQGAGRDTESGLYRALRRDYLTSLGRWLQRDPKWGGSGANLYSFVEGNPISFVDPSGTISLRPKLDSTAPLLPKQNLFPLRVRNEDNLIDMNILVNVQPHLLSQIYSSYYDVSVSLERLVDTQEHINRWNSQLMGPIGAGREYDSARLTAANLLLYVDMEVVGNSAKTGDDYVVVYATDPDTGAVGITKRWHATNGTQPPAMTKQQWKSLTRQQQLAWTTMEINSVTSDALRFDLPPCPGHGRLKVLVYHGERQRFHNKSWANFVITWELDQNRNFTDSIEPAPNTSDLPGIEGF